ncbi:hypothetical protein UPYG_G00221850 [Umbra pygmaea]|uniref:Small nuclear RNA activating complex polypeptide 1 n=1 Tax=Umbra pygmaea TaxID=75934 RepID=A0ABD0WZD0_UMBPY
MEYCKDHIKADCEQLLSRFQQMESVRFEMFLAIWKEMKFESIFFGKMESKLSRLFSREVLATAYAYLLPPYTFQIRVGAIYLLYGLYQCQLCTPREKIRVALKDWEVIMKFQQEAVNAHHFDVAYILRKLISQKAFYFTAMPTSLVFNVKRTNISRTLCEEFLERASRPQEVVSMDMLEELANIHQHYEQVKASSSESTSSQPDPSISLIHKDLVPRLHSTVLDFYKWQRNQGSGNQEEGQYEDGGEGTSNKHESSQRAKLLASIKSKSYAQVVEAPKARRHRQVERDESGPAQETSHHKRVKSLKQRTSHLTQDLVKEEATRMWCLSQLEAEDTTKEKKKQTFKW